MRRASSIFAVVLVLRESNMPDAELAALLRIVFNELCLTVPATDTSTRTNVASALLAAMKSGPLSVEDLKAAGRAGLRHASSMWALTLRRRLARLRTNRQTRSRTTWAG